MSNNIDFADIRDLNQRSDILFALIANNQL
jgi:hypothetical protein